MGDNLRVLHHLAILRKSSGALDKILDGRKTIESRWYVSRRTPWNGINRNDVVYFKYTGEPVAAKAEVQKALQFSELSAGAIAELLQRYGKEIGLEHEDLVPFAQSVIGKKYCILVFLKNAETVDPFDVDKTGYGHLAAWIATDDIRKIRKLRA